MESHIIDLLQRAILVTVMVSGPPIAAAMVVGLGLALVQALTQVQEQTLQMAFKIIAVFGTLSVLGYWMANQVHAFARLVFENFGTWVG